MNSMFLDLIRTGLRSFKKRKLHFLINIIGLSVSLTLCVLVFLYIRHEHSRDKFHSKGDRIFAVQEVNFLKDNPNLERSIFDTKPSEDYRKSVYLQVPLAPTLKEQFPEIAEISRYGFGNITVKKSSKVFSERAKYVDANFFDLFDFELESGNPETALNRIDKVVLTAEMASKYFGQNDPIGQLLNLDVSDSTAQSIFEVGGVITIPSNSSLKFDFLFRYENNRFYRNDGQDWNSYNTPFFVYLNENVDSEALEEKLEVFAEERYSQELKGIRAFRGMAEESRVRAYELVNLEDIYFNTEAAIGESSERLYSLILLGIAVLILFISCINYISISIATSSSRRQEIGVRKVIGATKKHLFKQLYFEILFLSLIAGLLSFTLTQVLLPFFNGLTGVKITTTPMDSLVLFVFSVAFAVFVSVISGIYPILMLAKFKALSALSSKSSSKVNPYFMRGLVAFQFALCILFVTISTSMHQQFKYISSKDLGFEEEAVVYVNNSNGLSEKLKQELAKNPEILSTSGAEGIFSGSSYSGSRTINGIRYSIRAVFTDMDFAKTFNMEVIDGRDLSPEFGEDVEGSNCLINETYWNLLKEDSTYTGSVHGMNVVGVIKDFHFEPLTKEINPLYIKMGSPASFSKTFFKLNPQTLGQGIEKIQAAYTSLAEERLFDLKFLDVFLETKYDSQKRWNKVINTSSFLGVLIACIGLFGLTGINAMNRMKEIGIRKVLGAGLRSIAVLLNKSTLWVLLISTLVAVPVATYFIDLWLENFAYSISITWDIFAVAISVCLVIVLATISYHSVKTSLINPTKLLRDE